MAETYTNYLFHKVPSFFLLFFKVSFSSIKKEHNGVLQQRTEYKQKTHDQVLVDSFHVIHLEIMKIFVAVTVTIKLAAMYFSLLSVK